MSETTPAWLLPISDDIHLCIGEIQAQAYIDDVTLYTVPLTPNHCHKVMFWQDIVIPVINMSVFIDDAVIEGNDENYIEHAFVLAYQNKDHDPVEFLALRLLSIPEKIQVNDESFCDIPNGYPEKMTPYLLSLFNYNNKLISIIDFNKMSFDAGSRVSS